MSQFSLEPFSALRAEDEPWLDQCYVPPIDFDRLLNNRSVIIFGSIGGGKTALYEMMKHEIKTEEGAPSRLLVDWRVAAGQSDMSGTTASVLKQLRHIYELCAVALAGYLLQFPTHYETAPDWAQARIGWFIHTALNNTPTMRLGPLLAKAAPGKTLLQALLDTKPVQVLYPDAPPEAILDELCLALPALGLQGIWVMADDIERLAQIDETVLLDNLLGLLATLPIFERSEFAFKLFVPSRLEGEISKASGLARRRIDAVRLHWSPEELRRMVEGRLAFATSGKLCKLEMLCHSPNLLPWLEKAGGDSPRHWLDQLQPLVKYYLTNQLATPIDEKIWRKLSKTHPPQFYLESARRTVVVGGREITLDEIPTKAIDMLVYLYEHGNQIVQKDELYFRAYMGMATVPRVPTDKGYEPRTTYEGIVDTNIWRLRGAIEPDPKKPILIETKRGQGLCLHVRW